MHLIQIVKGTDLSVIVATLVIAALVAIYLIVFLLSHTPRKAYPEEKEFLTIDENNKIIRAPVPTKSEDGIILSVVVPSYNETGRILNMLDETIKYLRSNFSDKWEVVIVDDGSKDGTSDYCLNLSHEKYALKPGQLRVIKFTKNRGKGGAVREGMLHIRGQYGLFADADGASKFSDVAKLIDAVKSLEKGKDGSTLPAIALGSRAHMVNTDAVIKRSIIRNCLMYGFHTLVFVFGIRSIKDTQCGFKLFNREAASLIFPYMHTEGWIFDVEILLLAFKKNIKVSEVQISWHEVGGSKMDLAIDSLMMAKDLIVIRMAYIFGIYNANTKC